MVAFSEFEYSDMDSFASLIYSPFISKPMIFASLNTLSAARRNAPFPQLGSMTTSGDIW